MIQLENATKYYDVKGKRKYIMRDVTLTIPANTNVGIMGRNGAGKSTFLRMLGGIDFPNSGRIVSKNHFSWPMGLAGGVQGSLTGKENAKFVCRIYSRSERELKDTLQFVQDFSELGHYFEMPVKTYSSGMRARLGFALSLAFDFDYYLIDETLSVGDVKFREKCRQALQKVKDTRNILLVNHNTRPLKQLCEAGVVLNDGELTYFDNIDDAVTFYQTEQVNP
jgi:capsular polysaccharide transport system ATP-binding protein